MGGTAFVLVLLIVGVLAITLVSVLVPSVTIDYDSPLNMVMFRSPGANRYTDQLVNYWVQKTWRSDSGRIPCRLEKGYAEAVPLADRRLIIYSHGNAEDMLLCAEFLRSVSESLHMDIVTWDYSGYGLNPLDKFERTAEGVNLSLRTIVDSLVAKGYAVKNMLFWGYSLGTGPSTQIVSALCSQKQKPLGLVLFGAYSSILDVVRDQTHPQVSQWFTERWNSKETIRNVDIPILLMHGQSDGMIRSKHSEILHAANPKSKLILFPNTGHTSFSWADTIKEVRTWIDESVR